MEKRLPAIVLLFVIVLYFVGCEESPQDKAALKEQILKDFRKTNVFDSPEKYGEHLVTIGGCNDCHTPKKMSPQGPVVDSTKTLSGHPAALPPPEINRKEMQGKGLIITNDLTTWVGPWGVSFAANLTPDDTGLKEWDINRFKTAIRFGKYHGDQNGRMLLPPMPWEMYRHMSDDELAAVFAYLKSLPPIANQVPAPLPPAQ